MIGELDQRERGVAVFIFDSLDVGVRLSTMKSFNVPIGEVLDDPGSGLDSEWGLGAAFASSLDLESGTRPLKCRNAGNSNASTVSCSSHSPRLLIRSCLCSDFCESGVNDDVLIMVALNA